MLTNITKTSQLTAKGRLKPGRQAKPKVKSTWVRSAPRPEVWVTGPDPRKHDIYTAWAKSRAQAHFRCEGWELTFDEYYAMWDPHWENRGRKPESMCMTRYDSSQPWNTKNARIVTRLEHLQGNGFSRKGKTNKKTYYTKLKV